MLKLCGCVVYMYAIHACLYTPVAYTLLLYRNNDVFDLQTAMHLLLPPIRYELLPEIERRFRGIGAGWARGTYGGSMGAWEALAVQVKYPTEYNGCIACAPDPIDFRALSPINIYNQTNAFRSGGGGVSHSLQLKEDQTGSARTYTGKMLATIEDDFRFEAALGGAVSGGQIGIWMAAYEAERRLKTLNVYRLV